MPVHFLSLECISRNACVHHPTVACLTLFSFETFDSGILLETGLQGDAIPSTVNIRTPTPVNSQIPAEEVDT